MDVFRTLTEFNFIWCSTFSRNKKWHLISTLKILLSFLDRGRYFSRLRKFSRTVKSYPILTNHQAKYRLSLEPHLIRFLFLRFFSCTTVQVTKRATNSSPISGLTHVLIFVFPKVGSQLWDIWFVHLVLNHWTAKRMPMAIQTSFLFELGKLICVSTLLDCPKISQWITT